MDGLVAIQKVLVHMEAYMSDVTSRNRRALMGEIRYLTTGVLTARLAADPAVLKLLAQLRSAVEVPDYINGETWVEILIGLRRLSQSILQKNPSFHDWWLEILSYEITDLRVVIETNPQEPGICSRINALVSEADTAHVETKDVTGLQFAINKLRVRHEELLELREAQLHTT
ncbi:TPA: hypothetical protein DCQ44_00200 [Candidatus Taylorbacteria bacterium]|nr:hypothetical protein [Candidatus Taylorbacteria bacterium]